jgi:isocitrate dehydrogenase kinase/phosphatase
MERELAERGADIVHRSFEELHESFRAITRRAVDRFEKCDWDGIRRDTVRRLGLHARAVDDTLRELREELGEVVQQRSFWAAMKECYRLAILGSDDFELAQTFYNSLTRRLFSHVGVEESIDFFLGDFPLPYHGWEMASARMYASRRVTPAVMRKVLTDAPFRIPFRDVEEAAARAAAIVERRLEKALGTKEIEALDFLRPVFIRNKGAYLVGRVRRGEQAVPVVLAILNDGDGLLLDAVVDQEDEISIVFSFARWYFHVDLPSPRQGIGFLHSILPRKRIHELYISLGYNKHGKTELFGDLSRTIAGSDERFVVAPGQRGLVMAVFTLPSYEFVFKVIRDHFPPHKRVSRRRVVSRYRQVLLHDRVGRLVDFQEFEHVTFPRRRFDDEVLDELASTAARTVGIEGEDVVVRHLYAGRRVVPLDLYLASASQAEQEAAVLDWGAAIKDLAAADIFAGDMLLKNFGVTRHGRVVFYDYDELRMLSECTFRVLPEPRSEEETMATEPWFTVGEDDIFPEELRSFLGLSGRLERLFMQHHGEIFEVDFWRTMQRRNREGEIIDVFPYSHSQQQQRAGASTTG